MKKKVWFVGMAVAAMTSCTQSEVLDVPESRLIGFETHVEKQTRAVNDITDGTEGFQELHVFGAIGTGSGAGFTVVNNKYIDHAIVKGGKGQWTYSPHASWVKDRTFRFAAYANGLATGDGAARIPETDDTDYVAEGTYVQFVPHETVGTETKWGLNINNYTVGDDDLIVAVPEEKVVTNLTTAPASVGLTFKHVLAKVIFQFRYTANTQNSNLHLDIAPFTVNAYRTGDCQLRFTGVEDNTRIGAVWTPEGALSPYVFFPQKAGGENQTWKSGNIQSEYYVIPQPNAGLTVPEITIDSYDGTVVTATTKFTNVSLRIADHENWLPGYVYRYIADITPGQHYIHFTTSVTSWIDEDNRNQTITNGPQTGGTPNP